jgi:hypothetical protein
MGLILEVANHLDSKYPTLNETEDQLELELIRDRVVLLAVDWGLFLDAVLPVIWSV